MRDNSNNQVRVGVGVLIFDEKGRVLLIKRTGSHGAGTWAPPGGHLDFGETAIEAAKRETKEETGIIIDNVQIIGFTEDFFKKENKHYITIWVKGDRAGGTLMENYREWTEAGFFDMKDVSRLDLFLTWKNFIEGRVLPKKILPR